jgi:hypothetical protein
VKEVVPKEQIREFFGQGKLIIPEIFPATLGHLGEGFRVIGIEEPLDTPLKGYLYDDEFTSSLAESLPFKGYIDLHAYQPKTNKRFIIDWKTCGWGWSRDKKQDPVLKAQLAMYKYYLCKKYGYGEEDFRKIELDFVLLKRTGSPGKRVEFFKVSAGPKTIRKSLSYINTLLWNMETERYMPNRLNCKWCPFKHTQYCP